MRTHHRWQWSLTAVTVLCVISSPALQAADSTEGPIKVTVDWDKRVLTSKTTPSILLINHPLLRKGRPVHDAALATIKKLDARYVRYLVYDPYPRLSIPELEAPTKEKTSWDFSLIDPQMIEFLEATKDREPIVNFSAVPGWMFRRNKPLQYPASADEMTEDAGRGKELLDPTGRQLGEYFARIVSWYTKGGFTGENGDYHRSGHYFTLPWWGVLNEMDVGAGCSTPQQYTICYDAIVSAIHKVSPTTKFVGMAVAYPANNPEFFQYFLDPAHHQPGIPLDMIGYHFYAGHFSGSSNRETIDEWQYTFFNQADGFFNTVRFVDSIRKRLTPATRVDLEELGIILPHELENAPQNNPATPALPATYWNLQGALFAYCYLEATLQSIDVATASWVTGYAPHSSLLDWKTGEANAWLRVVELIKNNFGPEDELVLTQPPRWPNGSADVAVQGFHTKMGRKLLLINKRMRPVEFDLKNAGVAGDVIVVDPETAQSAPRREQLGGGVLRLAPFAVAVVTTAAR